MNIILSYSLKQKEFIKNLLKKELDQGYVRFIEDCNLGVLKSPNYRDLRINKLILILPINISPDDSRVKFLFILAKSLGDKLIIIIHKCDIISINVFYNNLTKSLRSFNFNSYQTIPYNDRLRILEALDLNLNTYCYFL